MKKFIFALGLVVALSSCSGGAAKEEAPKADSTVCCVDTTACDSTATVVADTTK